MKERELRTGKASIYNKTLELTVAGEQLLAKADEMSRIAHQLTEELLNMTASYCPPEARIENLDTMIIDWFTNHGLALCDAYAVLHNTVRWLVFNPAARPGPVITEGMRKAYGTERISLNLSDCHGNANDPFVQWIERSREGTSGSLESEHDVHPYTEALIELFKSRKLTIREALSVIARVESGLVNDPSCNHTDLRTMSVRGIVYALEDR